MRRLEALRDLVRKHLDETHSRQERLYNRERRGVEISVGDSVLRRERVLSNAAQGISGKLAPRYAGPFVIKQVISPTIYLLEDTGRRVAKAHISELKRYVPPRGATTAR